MSVFQKLSDSFVIALGDRLLAGAGAYRVGMAAIAFPNKRSGEDFIDAHRTGIDELQSVLGDGDLHLEAAGDPWKLMRRAAGEGLAGIQGGEFAIFPERFMFMVRVEEAGVKLPTVLTCMTEEGWGSSLARTGEETFSHADLLHWVRFDILDNLTGEWGQRCPFRNWNHGDPLYELRTDDLVVLLADVPLLGDWNSTEGAFAFFTNEDSARNYLENYLGNGRDKMLVLNPARAGDSGEMMASLQVTPVHDLQQRLRELKDITPFAAWCINPANHRENASVHAVAMDGISSDPTPRMIAVSGNWSVQPDNIFRLEQSLAPWTGMDTVRWSGGQALQLTPLDRSFATGNVPDDIDLEDLTESDAATLATQLLTSDGDLEEAFGRLDSWNEIPDHRLDQFHMIAWDAVTGNGADFPWRFPNVLDALGFLATYERLHDRIHRSDGAVSCMHIGFSGSNDEEFESLRSQRFELGLYHITRRIVQDGYCPKDADDIVALCNGVLQTLHVDFAGYPKDLLYQSPFEKIDALCETLEIDEKIYRHWEKSVETVIDPGAMNLVLARMEVDVWESLLPRTQHFLATAFHHLELQGRAPQLDYAPICLEVVKALEVELVRVLEGYRDCLNHNIPVHDEDCHTDLSLVKYLKGGKAPTIGNMIYLLRKPGPEGSALARSLYEYILSLDNGQFLTSNTFAKKGLNRVVHKYRNGGVHDSAITWETCIECMETVIGTHEKPGYLPLLTRPNP